MCFIVLIIHSVMLHGHFCFYFLNKSTSALKNIIKKIMTISFSMVLLRKLQILVILIKWELILTFLSCINTCFVFVTHIYFSWINNMLATRSTKMRFNLLEKQVLKTRYTYLICYGSNSCMCRYCLLCFSYFNCEYN